MIHARRQRHFLCLGPTFIYAHLAENFTRLQNNQAESGGKNKSVTVADKRLGHFVMVWVRSRNKHYSNMESGLPPRYTWHLLCSGEASCNVGGNISGVVADAPPDGDKVCINCKIISDGQSTNSEGR